jgi:phosphatidylethanolamine/phosphatidyl-N-methylethanolamine N-methyltransferase
MVESRHLKAAAFAHCILLPVKNRKYSVLKSTVVGFLKEFISKPTTTGAVAPSSPFLAQMMVDGLDLGSAETVLEYGPGTGVFTEYILRELKPASKFAAIELNPKFAEAFKARYPAVPLFEDSVANVRAICDHAGMPLVDCIVSGLPWAAFSESMQLQFLDEMMRVLKPGGRFVTFAYMHGLALPPAKRFAGLLPNYFTSVSKSPVVWMNVPPAFVYRCRR